MLDYMIGLMAAYVGSGIFEWVIIPIFALCFVACVPCIIMYFVRR